MARLSALKQANAGVVRHVGRIGRFCGLLHFGLGAVRGEIGPEHPDSGFMEPRSTTQRCAKLVQQAEKHMPPRIPRQQPIHDPPIGRENLSRNPHHRGEERAELHPQQLPFLFPVPPLPTACFRQHQRRPRLQAQRQRRHHHVRPIREQAIHRRGRRANTASTGFPGRSVRWRRTRSPRLTFPRHS